jgi:hypothetical protein
VTVADTWHFTGGNAPSALRFLLAGQVELPSPGQVVVRPPGGGRAALVTWDPARTTAALTVRRLNDNMLSDVWGDRLTRLELILPGTAHGGIEVQVEVCQ